MIGELVDRLVGVFDPQRAAKRALARHVMSRGYDAAGRDRRTTSWRPANQSADAELYGDADTIRARARDLVRNNAYAEGMVRAITRNVVGIGIRPQSRLETPDGKPRERENKAIEDAFRRWSHECDVTGRLDFFLMQRLIERELIEAGEVLVRFVRSRSKLNPVGFQLELIEADRLATDQRYPQDLNRETNNEIRRGVELNSAGKPVAYWIYAAPPDDVYSYRVRDNAVRVPAFEVMHLFHQKRIGQTRGVSEFAPVIRWLKDLGYYLENELVSSAIASCFSVAITTLAGPADGGLLGGEDSASDTDGNDYEYLQPGMMPRLMPGEDVSVINPTRQQSQADAWIALMLRSMAVGMGLSYERLTRDYSETNYSSNRASDLEDRREFRPRQNYLIENLCRPVWVRFMNGLAQRGAVSAQDLITDPDRMYAAEWQPPGWEWVDPLKEIQASAFAIDNNLSTLSRELAKSGQDLNDTINQRAREQQMIEEAGLAPEPEPMESEEDAETPEDQEATGTAV